MNVIDALNWRYAVRQFSNEQLAESRVERLLETTRLSATSYGLQPYRMLLLNDIEQRKQLLPYAMGQDKVVNCSHLVVLAAQTQPAGRIIDRYIDEVAFTREQPKDDLQGLSLHMKQVFESMSTEQQKQWAHQQAYIALGTLLTTAALMEIDTCPMTGFDQAGFDRVLGLEKCGLESSSICALGIRHPDDANAHLKKVRYAYSEMVLTL